MKRSLLLGGLCAALLCPRPGAAIDFDLKTREPGPGHLARSYWWKVIEDSWELIPPESFSLLGGGELRLQKTSSPSLVATCRQATSSERDLFVKKDPAVRDAYFRTLLPGGIKDARLVSQEENPLPVNNLHNVEAVYAYNLGGVAFRAAYMVNRIIETKDQKPGQTSPPKEDYFTAVIVAPADNQAELYQAFQQLMANAKIKSGEPDADRPGQYVSHGMLGR